MTGKTKVKPSPIFVPSRTTTTSNISTLTDSHFQLPIRRLPTRSNENDEYLDSTQHEAADDLDSTLKKISEDLSSNAEWNSQADVATEEGSGKRRAATHNNFVPTPQDLKEFYEAIAAGDIDIVKLKLKLGLCLWHRSEDGLTPLVIAITKDQLEMARFLLENGASVHQKAKHLAPIAHAACTDGNAPRLIQLLLDSGADLNMASGPGQRNALHWAARYGMVDAVNFLVDRGIDPDLRDRGGWEALHWAAEYGHSTVIKVLLAKGADKFCNRHVKAHLLPIAACSGDIRTVKLLLEEKLAIDQFTWGNINALMVASGEGHVQVVRLLLEQGANVNAMDEDGEGDTALGRAVVEGKVEVVKLLLEHEADLGHTNKSEQTILELAMTGGHRETVDVLLKAIDGEYPWNNLALDLAITDSYPSTVSLMATASQVFSEIFPQKSMKNDYAWIEWVLEMGTSLLKPRVMANIMECALQEGNIDIVEELIVLGCDSNKNFSSGHTPLSAAICHRKVDMVRLLLGVGADPMIPARVPDNEFTPLYQALVLLEPDFEKDTSIVDALLDSRKCKLMNGEHLDRTVFSYILSQIDKWDHGVAEILTFRMLESVGIPENDLAEDGSTLLHVAVHHDRKDLVDILLQQGLDINAVNKRGESPFLMGCQKDIHMVTLLCSRGADLSIQNSYDQSPLHIAASRGDTKTISFLLSKGLDIHACDKSNQTPLMRAIRRRQEKASLQLLYHDPSTRSAKVGGQNKTILHLAAMGQMQKLATKLLTYDDMDINAQDSLGTTPLALACRSWACSTQMITFLLDAGADIEMPNNVGDRPLHVAVMGQADPSCAQFLVQRGASLTHLDSEGRTPLQIAIIKGNLLAARAMLQRGAMIDDRDLADETLRSMYDSPELTQLLIDYGANVNHIDANGRTPLHDAMKWKNLENFEVLVKAGARLDEGMLGFIEGFEDCDWGRDGMEMREGLVDDDSRYEMREQLLDIVVRYHPELARRYGRKIIV